MKRWRQQRATASSSKNVEEVEQQQQKEEDAPAAKSTIRSRRHHQQDEEAAAPSPQVSTSASLSNLWSRKHSIPDSGGSSSGTEEGTAAATTTPAGCVVRSVYPKIRDHTVRVPHVDGLLSRAMPFQQQQHHAQKRDSEAREQQQRQQQVTDPAPSVPAVVKPGAVAANSVAPPAVKAKQESFSKGNLPGAISMNSPPASSKDNVSAVPLHTPPAERQKDERVPMKDPPGFKVPSPTKTMKKIERNDGAVDLQPMDPSEGHAQRVSFSLEKQEQSSAPDGEGAGRLAGPINPLEKVHRKEEQPPIINLSEDSNPATGKVDLESTTWGIKSDALHRLDAVSVDLHPRAGKDARLDSRSVDSSLQQILPGGLPVPGAPVLWGNESAALIESSGKKSARLFYASLSSDPSYQASLHPGLLGKLGSTMLVDCTDDLPSQSVEYGQMEIKNSVLVPLANADTVKNAVWGASPITKVSLVDKDAGDGTVDVPRAQTWGSKPSAGRLDDDDEKEIEGSAKNPMPLLWGTGVPVWGKKTGKASLEEDAPNSKELAFAEVNIASQTRAGVISSSNDEMKSSVSLQISLVSVASAAGQIPLAATAARSNKYESVPKPQERQLSGSGDPSITEDEQLQAAIRESQQQQEQGGTVKLITGTEVEDIKENARNVRSIAASEEFVDTDLLQTVLSMLKEDQKKITDGIEAVMATESGEDIEVNLETLIDLNANVLDAIEIGEEKANDFKKPAARKAESNLDVQQLVNTKDIFSLICMLRVHQNEKRLDAAMALMEFARVAEKKKDREAMLLRDEIRSTGGIHSLLTLFRTNGISNELKVVTALAIAYVLPSFVESSTQTSATLGIKIVDCLRFLTRAQPVSHRGEVLDSREMFNAASMALAAFWVNHLEPILKTKRSRSSVVESSQLRRNISASRQRDRGANLRQESIALDELLETTVSLVIFVAKNESTDLGTHGSIDFRWIHTLVEQICAVEVARPIAVREGILQVLVSWIRSNDHDKIRPAASALRYVTSIEDKYMAGWIHSEMVNKGAVICLAELTHDITVTREVRLIITQILSSLCAAPHTRAAVVDANCVHFLIGVLYEHNDPSADDLAYYAAHAILQLVAGAITRASAFSAEDRDHYLSSDKRDTLVG
jgi:hypothetical protein